MKTSAKKEKTISFKEATELMPFFDILMNEDPKLGLKRFQKIASSLVQEKFIAFRTNKK